MYKIVWHKHYFSVPNNMLLFQNVINNIQNSNDFLILCNTLLDCNNWDIFYKIINDIINDIENMNILSKEHMWSLILFDIVLS